ncbi:Ninja-family protein AFP3-like protein [Drosera capensis]
MAETDKTGGPGGGGDDSKPNCLMSRQLVERFMENLKKKEDGEEESIELTLGLSLNGKFGVNPVKARNLARSSSSVPVFLTWEKAEKGLARTLSMPAVAEEERERKEEQTMRRMKAKRKRAEKSMSGPAGGGPSVCAGNEKSGLVGPDAGPHVGKGIPQLLPLPLQLLSSQGSAGYAGASDLGNPKIGHETNKPVEAKSRNGGKSSPVSNNQKPALPPSRSSSYKGILVETTNGSPPTKPGAAINGTSEILKDMLALSKMPRVYIKGYGAKGEKVHHGFLYRYRKGEEVRILCVCHGSFFTPAEFIKHAGGGDVEHPLRQIVVNPSPLMS